MGPARGLTTPATPAPTSRRRRAGWLVAISIAVLAAGALAWGTRPGRATPTAGLGVLHATPTEFVVTLAKGEHGVYEHCGFVLKAGPRLVIPADTGTVLEPDLVTVTAPDGSLVPTLSRGWTPDTFLRGTQRYTATVRFAATAPGVYRVRVDGPTTEVAIERTDRGSWAGATRVVIFGLALVTLLLIGLFMAAVRFRRRRGWLLTPFGANQLRVPAPPAWHVDPYDARILRYWDGRAWTSHTNPRPDASAAAAPSDEEVPR